MGKKLNYDEIEEINRNDSFQVKRNSNGIKLIWHSSSQRAYHPRLTLSI